MLLALHREATRFHRPCMVVPLAAVPCRASGLDLLTHLRHWPHTTKMLSIPVSALSKCSLSPLRCRLLSFGVGHAAPWFHYATRRRCGVAAYGPRAGGH